ncbi:GspE/PulE family protein [soil metagenome]
MDALAACDEGFLDFLETEQILDRPAAARARSALKATHHPVDLVILELGLLSESRLADIQARYLGAERAAPRDFREDLLHDPSLPGEFLRRSGLVPLAGTGGGVLVATARPFDTDAIRALGYYLTRRVTYRIATASDVATFFRQMAQLDDASPSSPGEARGDAGSATEDDIERLRDIAREAPVIRQVNRIIALAAERHASDIHVEPLEDHVQIRFRIDGALTAAETLPKDMQAGFVSRIKIMARLNIAEQRLPQDGRLKIPIRGEEVDLRISTIPTLYGESVVLRILNRENVTLDYAALGFSPDAIARLRRLTAQANGIILVTGPTGSGKTTTLYTALRELNRPESKVFTVDDPIEYHLDGVHQTHVRPQIGLDFAASLRSILRQDPDIIMVGEIRDRETAGVAVQASLTGHLVLSTVHTNSAIATIARLLDMGVEDYLLTSVLRSVVGQRLVRRLCPHCRAPRAPPPDLVRHLAALASPIALDVAFAPVGCAQCSGTGYRGRTTIYEILEMTDPLRERVIARAAAAEIALEARRGGMVPLFDCGIAKAAAGETSLEEVMRVTSAS